MGLSWSKGTAKPLEQVSLIANVEDSLSLVGLCIADKSSTIIKRQNDLTSRVSMTEHSRAGIEYYNTVGHFVMASVCYEFLYLMGQSISIFCV